MTAPSTVAIDAPKFEGGQGLMRLAGGLGAVGMLGALAGVFVDAKAAFFSYLVAFTYWAGIALASLIMLMIFHAFRAKWPVVLRRPLEAMAVTTGLFVLLVIPVVVGLKHIYTWVEPAEHFTNHEQLEILHHKAAWLHPARFIMRTFGYLLVAAMLAQRFFSLSTRQDESGDQELTVKQRNLSVGALPLMALVITFAAFDWLMTLDPLWFSTIFGVYYFAGSFWSALAILTLVMMKAKGRGQVGAFATVEHQHNLGKLLLAFTAFWGYIAVSQLLLIWISNLPEEIPFYLVRFKERWAAVGIGLMVIHFFVPFGWLLSRNLKRTPRLAVVCVLVLFAHFVDIYWLVMPALSPDRLVFPWMLPFAFFGVGGLAAAFAVWRIRGRHMIPVKDPFLGASLRYRQPT